jgi:hypothetical protein
MLPGGGSDLPARYQPNLANCNIQSASFLQLNLFLLTPEKADRTRFEFKPQLRFDPAGIHR